MVFTVKELAAELKISLSLAYKLVADGEIASYKVASCRRVKAEDIEEYLERQRYQPIKRVQSTGKHF
jgi:excisionase family DNA binding protein